jgi:acyl-CoA thioesterase I
MLYTKSTKTLHKMIKLLYIIPIAALTIAFIGKKDETKIACVGDSITEGAWIANEAADGYPSVLEKMLGNHYKVLNAGRGWATVSKMGDVPYWSRNEFHNVFAFRPDIIVIKLGTNDSKPRNWNAETFPKDLQALIDTFMSIPSHPEIILCYPAKSYARYSDIRDSVITSEIIPAIDKIAKVNHLPVVDLHTALSNHSELYADSIHPREGGARIIATEIAKEILKQNN